MIEIKHRVERRYRGTRKIEVRPIHHRELVTEEGTVEITTAEERALWASASSLEFHIDGTVVLDRDRQLSEHRHPSRIGNNCPQRK